MKLKDFQKWMPKAVFSSKEAQLIGWKGSPKTLTLQLSQWAKAGDLVRLKRGLYAFPVRVKDAVQVARALYEPCYLSLEFALNAYGLIPDVPFAMTLVTPKATRRFKTPFGEFVYQTLSPKLFWGYDPDTLMGEREKVILDYLYLNSGRLRAKSEFWREMRWQNLDQVDFRKAKKFAARFGVEKVRRLLLSLEDYGKAEKNR